MTSPEMKTDVSGVKAPDLRTSGQEMKRDRMRLEYFNLI